MACCSNRGWLAGGLGCLHCTAVGSVKYASCLGLWLPPDPAHCIALGHCERGCLCLVPLDRVPFALPSPAAVCALPNKHCYLYSGPGLWHSRSGPGLWHSRSAGGGCGVLTACAQGVSYAQVRHSAPRMTRPRVLRGGDTAGTLCFPAAPVIYWSWARAHAFVCCICEVALPSACGALPKLWGGGQPESAPLGRGGSDALVFHL